MAIPAAVVVDDRIQSSAPPVKEGVWYSWRRRRGEQGRRRSEATEEQSDKRIRMTNLV